MSYYDYYQPEAYIAHTDTYIEKDASINEEIDWLRLAATASLLALKQTTCIVLFFLFMMSSMIIPIGYS